MLFREQVADTDVNLMFCLINRLVDDKSILDTQNAVWMKFRYHRTKTNWFNKELRHTLIVIAHRVPSQYLPTRPEDVFSF